MLSTRVRTLPGRTAAHAWRTALFSSATVEGGHPCIGSWLTFDPKHAQLGSCLDSELASPWPQHPVGPKRLSCHVLYGVENCLDVQKVTMATFDSSGSGCTDAGSWLHPPRPAHSSPHSGLHPISWLTGHDFHQYAERRQQSASPLACGAPGPDRHCGIGRTGNHQIQYLHCLRAHILCLLPHSRRRRLCSKVSLRHWLNAETNIRRPDAISKWFELTYASQIGGSSAFADEEPRWSGSFWPFGVVDSHPLAWRFSSNLHDSSDVVGQSLSCVAKFCLCILETPPASRLLLAENCHLPTTRQFAAVFALINFVAWSPLKVQRNINSLYRNPTLHKSIKVVMAKQTSLQVTTHELTFSLACQRSPDNTDCVWQFNLVTWWIDEINSISFRNWTYDQKQ